MNNLTYGAGCVRLSTKGNSSRHELMTAMQHLCSTLEGVPLSRDLQLHVKPW